MVVLCCVAGAVTTILAEFTAKDVAQWASTQHLSASDVATLKSFGGTICVCSHLLVAGDTR